MLKQLELLKNAAGKAQDSVAGAASRTHEAVAGTLGSTQAALATTAHKAHTTVVESIGGSANSAKNAVFGTVESTVRSARDTVLDARDDALGLVVRKVGGVADAGRLFICTLEIPVMIGMYVAPVPVGVGLALLALAEFQFGGSLDKLESELEESKARRKFDREVGLLQKYGKIPATAVLTSDDLVLDIQSNPLKITGSVKTGKLVGRTIESLGHGELEHIFANSRDPNTHAIVRAYQKLLTSSGVNR